jgi:hypothetical protein
VSIAQIFNQIEKDARVYCSGGWDERFSWIGQRNCYKFKFSPLAIVRLTICTRDDRVAQITTSDQLMAVRFFQDRYGSLECFRILSRGGYAYEITEGRDAIRKRLQFSSDAPQEEAFCGCNEDEIKEIAKVSGATLH